MDAYFLVTLFSKGTLLIIKLADADRDDFIPSTTYTQRPEKDKNKMDNPSPGHPTNISNLIGILKIDF